MTLNTSSRLQIDFLNNKQATELRYKPNNKMSSTLLTYFHHLHLNCLLCILSKNRLLLKINCQNGQISQKSASRNSHVTNTEHQASKFILHLLNNSVTKQSSFKVPLLAFSAAFSCFLHCCYGVKVKLQKIQIQKYFYHSGFFS